MRPVPTKCRWCNCIFQGFGSFLNAYCSDDCKAASRDACRKAAIENGTLLPPRKDAPNDHETKTP